MIQVAHPGWIRDPDPDFLPIPDPGVKKAPDSGSATLVFRNQIWISINLALPDFSTSILTDVFKIVYGTFL